MSVLDGNETDPGYWRSLVAELAVVVIYCYIIAGPLFIGLAAISELLIGDTPLGIWIVTILIGAYLVVIREPFGGYADRLEIYLQQQLGVEDPSAGWRG